MSLETCPEISSLCNGVQGYSIFLFGVSRGGCVRNPSRRCLGRCDRARVRKFLVRRPPLSADNIDVNKSKVALQSVGNFTFYHTADGSDCAGAMTNYSNVMGSCGLSVEGIAGNLGGAVEKLGCDKLGNLISYR